MTIHPIIKTYIESLNNRLDLALERVVDKNNLIEMVILDIFIDREKNSGLPNQSILSNIDKALIKGHPDTNVFLLFIYCSIVYSHVFGDFKKNKAYYSIGLSSINENVHPSIRDSMLHANILIKEEEGNLVESKKLMHELLTRTDKNSQKFYPQLINYSMGLAFTGCLTELKKEYFKIIDLMETEKRSWNHTYVKLANSILVGNSEDGFQILNNFYTLYPDSKLNLHPFHMANTELRILSGDLIDSNYKEEHYKKIVQIYNNLSHYKFGEAAKNYLELRNSNFESFAIFKITEYIPFHIELGLGNIGRVRVLLNEKKEKGNYQYLDDLFYGRMYLLEKNEQKTEEAFVRLTENISRYGAMQRLIFELQFAKEMKLNDILHLTNGWKKDIKSKITKKLSSRIPKVKNSDFDLIIGSSPEIQNVRDLIKKIAPLKTLVLITGETGTGKDLVARAIHSVGNNPEEPFLAINCGALTESLLQSELFGYVAGAFTGAQKERLGIFEAAGKGTVFLDEFGELNAQSQVSLLRVLESMEIRMIGGTSNRKINCRIIVATNKNLINAVAEKKFREDLYFRVSKFEIRLPTLRERISDLPQLVNHFLNLDNEPKEKIKKISDELLKALATYRWPGNIRELKNEIEKLKILHIEKNIINIEDFSFDQLQGYTPKKVDVVEEELISNPLRKISENNIKTSTNNITSDYIVKIIQRGSKVDQRIAFIKDLFRQYKKLTRSQIIEILKVNPSTATNELQMLCDEGFIVRRTPTKSTSTYYFEIVS